MQLRKGGEREKKEEGKEGKIGRKGGIFAREFYLIVNIWGEIHFIFSQ